MKGCSVLKGALWPSFVIFVKCGKLYNISSRRLYIRSNFQVRTVEFSVAALPVYWKLQQQQIFIATVCARFINLPPIIPLLLLLQEKKNGFNSTKIFLDFSLIWENWKCNVSINVLKESCNWQLRSILLSHDGSSGRNLLWHIGSSFRTI